MVTLFSTCVNRERSEMYSRDRVVTLSWWIVTDPLSSLKGFTPGPLGSLFDELWRCPVRKSSSFLERKRNLFIPFRSFLTEMMQGNFQGPVENTVTESPPLHRVLKFRTFHTLPFGLETVVFRDRTCRSRWRYTGTDSIRLRFGVTWIDILPLFLRL